MTQLRFARQLQNDLQSVLGAYSHRGGPLLFHPVLYGNTDSGATLMHELAHEWLTLNTPYGVFYQLLENRARREPAREEQVEMCLQAQWGAQEALASYLEIVYVATHHSGRLDRAISQLPTERLGEPPYREWFDRLDRLLPLDDAARLRDTARVAVCGLVAEGVACFAMHGDILRRFPAPESVSTATLREYLRREAPDLRFERAVDALAGNPARLQQLIALAGRDTESPGPVAIELARMLDDSEFLDPGTWNERITDFAGAWRAIPRAEREVAGVVYPPDWERRVVAFPDPTLSADVLDGLLEGARTGRHNLICSIAMIVDSEAHFTALPHPRGASNDETWTSILQMLDNGAPATEGAFSMVDLQHVLDRSRGTPVALNFMRDSWRVWRRVAPAHFGLRITAEICTEWELTESRFRSVLEFHDSGAGLMFRLFHVYGDQSAALILDSRRPGRYVVLGVPGEGAGIVLNELVTRFRIPMSPKPITALPDWPVVRLAGQSFLA